MADIYIFVCYDCDVRGETLKEVKQLVTMVTCRSNQQPQLLNKPYIIKVQKVIICLLKKKKT